MLHGVQRHVAEDGEVLWPVAQPCPVLVLVHDDIKPPVQAVLHLPMMTDDLVEALRGQGRAVQRCWIGGIDAALPPMRGDVRRLIARGVPEPARV